MTPKEFAELKKLRVRVESQRQEIKRLQAENAALKAAQTWTVIRKPTDMPPLTEYRETDEDGDEVPGFWVSVPVLICTVDGAVDIAIREENYWNGWLRDYDNVQIKAWMPILAWTEDEG